MKSDDQADLVIELLIALKMCKDSLQAYVDTERPERVNSKSVLISRQFIALANKAIAKAEAVAE